MIGNRLTSRPQKGINMEGTKSMQIESKSGYRRFGSLTAAALVATFAVLGVFSAGASAVPFAIPTFEAAGLNADMTPSVAAGGAPSNVINNFTISTDPPVPPNVEVPAGNLKDVKVELPPGIVGNASSFPQCPQERMDQAPSNCPPNAQIGFAKVKLRWGYVAGGWQYWTRPVYNMVPPPGTAAQFAFRTLIATTHIDFTVRTGTDYGVNANIHNTNGSAPVMASEVTIWGVPADPANNHLRVNNASNNPGEMSLEYPEPAPYKVLVSNPTSCNGPVVTKMAATSWQNPTSWVSPPPAVAPAMTGCNALEFDPTIQAKPSTNLADSPSGFEFHLHVPQRSEVDPLQEELINPDEVQRLDTRKATEGKFKLRFEGQTTEEIEIGAYAWQVQPQLESLSSIGGGNVSVEGGGYYGGAEPYKIHFQGALAGKDVEQIVVLPGAPAPNGALSMSTITQGGHSGQFKNVGVQPFHATAHVRDTRVVLPPSLTVNPSSANGREACSPTQIGLTTSVGVTPAEFTEAAANCPDASKLGTVRIDSPAVIDHPLQGNVYLAAPHQNPFGSLLAMYIVVEDAKSGIIAKIPAQIEANPKTGQLTTVITNGPRLPYEDVQLEFLKGAVAPLKTGIACGTSTVTSDLVPWSAPEGATMHPQDSFTIEKGAGGGACLADEGAAPKQPKFEAGTLDPTAGIYSPFVLRLSRQDGTQQLTGIDTTLPKGLIARLAGTSYCSDQALTAAAQASGRSEQDHSSCPSASQVGTVNVGAGAGPSPYYTSGNAYLAGPYKGAPLSLAVVTPAVAGPFDLGTVVIRNALYVDPESTVVHAVSDPFPSILQGIPLDLRSIVLKLDRDRFTRNPTSCNPLAIDGTVSMLTGQSAATSNRFQVGDCARLAFKPKLSLTLKGGTTRNDHPALKAVLTARDGEANIAGAAVTLPRSEFLENAHIKTICTRVQFAADACPSRSVYGKARAFTPLLDKPLEGPVYLRSSSHELPDLVADLRGQIHVVLVGRIDSVNKGIRNTFEAVPDAPVSKFVLEMQGGKKGLLVNNRNLCKTVNKATALFDAQNGKTFDQRPVVGNSCKKARKGAAGKKRR